MLLKAEMASGLATVILFCSQLLVVGVGAVWVVKETFFFLCAKR